jgi:hypothetical protein
MIKIFLQISLVKYIDLNSRNRGNISISKYLLIAKYLVPTNMVETNYLIKIEVLFVVFH